MMNRVNRRRAAPLAPPVTALFVYEEKRHHVKDNPKKARHNALIMAVLSWVCDIALASSTEFTNISPFEHISSILLTIFLCINIHDYYHNSNTFPQAIHWKNTIVDFGDIEGWALIIIKAFCVFVYFYTSLSIEESIKIKLDLILLQQCPAYKVQRCHTSFGCEVKIPLSEINGQTNCEHLITDCITDYYTNGYTSAWDFLNFVKYVPNGYTPYHDYSRKNGCCYISQVYNVLNTQQIRTMFNILWIIPVRLFKAKVTGSVYEGFQWIVPILFTGGTFATVNRTFSILEAILKEYLRRETNASKKYTEYVITGLGFITKELTLASMIFYYSMYFLPSLMMNIQIENKWAALGWLSLTRIACTCGIIMSVRVLTETIPNPRPNEYGLRWSRVNFASAILILLFSYLTGHNFAALHVQHVSLVIIRMFWLCGGKSILDMVSGFWHNLIHSWVTGGKGNCNDGTGGGNDGNGDGDGNNQKPKRRASSKTPTKKQATKSAKVSPKKAIVLESSEDENNSTDEEDENISTDDEDENNSTDDEDENNQEPKRRASSKTPTKKQAKEAAKKSPKKAIVLEFSDEHGYAKYGVQRDQTGSIASNTRQQAFPPATQQSVTPANHHTIRQNVFPARPSADSSKERSCNTGKRKRQESDTPTIESDDEFESSIQNPGSKRRAMAAKPSATPAKVVPATPQVAPKAPLDTGKRKRQESDDKPAPSTKNPDNTSRVLAAKPLSTPPKAAPATPQVAPKDPVDVEEALIQWAGELLEKHGIDLEKSLENL